MSNRLVCSLALLGSLLGFALGANYTTRSWHSKIEVDKSRGVLVTETIAVTFSIPQHGLIRKLPITKHNGRKSRSVRYRIDSVEVDTGGGFRRTDKRESIEGENLSLRIGSAATTITGDAVFRIKYLMEDSLTDFPTDAKLGPHTELYFTAIPTEWATPISSGSVEVTTPPPAKGPFVARLLVGESGSRKGLEVSVGGTTVGDTSLFEAVIEPGHVTAKCKKPLALHEGVAVMVSMPDGTLWPANAEPALPPVYDKGDLGQEAQPSPLDRLWLFSGLLPLLPLIWLAVARHMRRENLGPIVVQFEAPDGVTAADSGVIIDGKLDRRDLVAALIELAQVGLVTLNSRKKEETQIVINDKKGNPSLTTVEDALYGSLAQFRPMVTAEGLRGTFASSYQHIQRLARVRAFDEGWLTRKSWMDEVGKRFVIATVLLAAVATYFNACAGPIACVIALVWGLKIMAKAHQRSEKGSRIYAQLLGLKEFITRAAEPELNYMSRVAPSQALFERLLPFAVAFGAVPQWSEAFKGIELNPPEWYAGYSESYSNWPALFVADMYTAERDYGSAMTQPAPTVHTSSSSSSSDSSWSSGDSSFGGSYDSGGGFSSGGDVGGGSGGGGGDSW